jgi:glycosyltransferase involved in cell wall biosynthesis
MIRVGLDVAPLGRTRAGTARYIHGLLEGLAGMPDLDVQRLAFGRGASALGDVVWYPLALPLQARGRDVLHCPGIRAPLRSSVPVVMTVHDVAVLRHGKAFPRWSRTYSRLVLPHAVRAARLLVADSEFTRREVIELLDVAEERIRVVPLAAGAQFSPDGPATEGEYVFTVGTLEPRKNLRRLAEAARRVGVELRVAGERGWGGVDAVGKGVRWLGRVPDPELPQLYRGALCVAYPSLYEGFGLPVLEAMACGAPVVTSAGGATEELANGAAVLVDPTDVEQIAAGIREAIERAADLQARGLQRAAAFSWRATAEATAAVYREAAG